jgi:hypothetical protein
MNCICKYLIGLAYLAVLTTIGAATIDGNTLGIALKAIKDGTISDGNRRNVGVK